MAEIKFRFAFHTLSLKHNFFKYKITNKIKSTGTLIPTIKEVFSTKRFQKN